MKNKRMTYFVLPEHESEWRVSLSGVAAPTGPTYLYSFAKSVGFGDYKDGRCVDFSIHDEDKFLSEIKEDDLVCTTTTVSNYNNAIDFIGKAKEQGAVCSIGGPWATVKAKQIQKHQQMVDYIIRNEGEPGLRDLLFDTAGGGIIHREPILVSDLPQINLSGWTNEDLQKFYDNYVTMLKTGAYGPVPENIPVYSFYQSSRGCIQKPRCGFCGSRLGLYIMSGQGHKLYLTSKE